MSPDLTIGNRCTEVLTINREHEVLPPKKRKISVESYLPDGTPDGIISASFVLAGLHSQPNGINLTDNAMNPVKKSCKDVKKPNKVQKAAQIRYDPEVPMSSQEKAVWRREQRRMRNRESAAASRKKTRDRISGLENELKIWKDKYNGALMKLKVLEAQSCPINQTNILDKEQRVEKHVVSPLTLPMDSPPTMVENLSF